jgi:hypothetical protein
MATVTTQGTTAGFAVGSALPAAVSGNSEYFVIVTTAGNMTPPGGVATDVHPGDWWLSTGTAYQLIDSGQATAVPATPFGFGTVYGCTTSTSATINTFLGFRAGRCIVTGGAANVFLGACSGAALATGTDNVFVGVFTGRTITDSQYNTFIGSQSGRSQAGGCFNTFTGAFSGFGSSGCDNTFIGYATGNNYRGNGNTGLGAQSMLYSDAGACFNTALGAYSMGQSGSYTPCNNVAVGYCSALYTEGCNNVAIGYNVQLPVVSASCQLAIGFDDGQFWLTGNSTKAIQPGAGIIDCAGSCGTSGQVLSSNGSNAIVWATPTIATPTTLGVVYASSNNSNQNVALGWNAGKSLNTGGNNTFIGQNAGCSQSGGFSNVAIGLNAACSLTSGNNTVIGVNSGKSITSGSYNVLVGEVTGCSLVTGGANTHVGFGAGTADTACYNTFIGNAAGKCSTTGCYNVALGESAFAFGAVTTATGATALGQGALRNTSGSGGSGSTAVGLNAGCCATTGTNNTFVGAVAGSNLTTGSCNVAIGYGVNLASATGNGQLAIGIGANNWLTGTSSFAIKPGAGIVDSTGSCGTAGQMLTSTGANQITWATPLSVKTTGTVTSGNTATLYQVSVPANQFVAGNILVTIQGTGYVNTYSSNFNYFWDGTATTVSGVNSVISNNASLNFSGSTIVSNVQLDVGQGGGVFSFYTIPQNGNVSYQVVVTRTV